jgi:hypothetical protein
MVVTLGAPSHSVERVRVSRSLTASIGEICVAIVTRSQGKR